MDNHFFSEEKVHSSWLICTECGHGGHSDHMAEWFDTFDKCPAVNCDHKCFPKKERNVIAAQIKSVTCPGVVIQRNSNNYKFWTYKLTP